MILKTKDAKNANVTMTLNIDYVEEKITIHIRHWNKRFGKVSGYDYSASEFPRAIKKFNELTMGD